MFRNFPHFRTSAQFRNLSQFFAIFSPKCFWLAETETENGCSGAPCWNLWLTVWQFFRNCSAIVPQPPAICRNWFQPFLTAPPPPFCHSRRFKGERPIGAATG